MQRLVFTFLCALAGGALGALLGASAERLRDVPILFPIGILAFLGFCIGMCLPLPHQKTLTETDYESALIFWVIKALDSRGTLNLNELIRTMRELAAAAQEPINVDSEVFSRMRDHLLSRRILSGTPAAYTLADEGRTSARKLATYVTPTRKIGDESE
jgi:hypothetical protein